MLDFDLVIVDAPIEPRLRGGDAARPELIKGRLAKGIVDFEAEDAAQVIAGDKVEKESRALTPIGGLIAVARRIVIFGREVALKVRKNVVDEPRHAEFGPKGGGHGEYG